MDTRVRRLLAIVAVIIVSLALVWGGVALGHYSKRTIGDDPAFSQPNMFRPIDAGSRANSIDERSVPPKELLNSVDNISSSERGWPDMTGGRDGSGMAGSNMGGIGAGQHNPLDGNNGPNMPSPARGMDNTNNAEMMGSEAADDHGRQDAGHSGGMGGSRGNMSGNSGRGMMNGGGMGH